MYQTLIIKDANSQVRFTHTEPAYQAFSIELLGTLRSDNGDVHENVAGKHFKLFRDYPNSLCHLKEGDFGWS